ncbi:MAG: glutamate formimidoyltransferase [Candidatus Rokubacteria bacterium]|nr:glutamate formimidoyltransferase [Candidatus Rokubacteria bacterium]
MALAEGSDSLRARSAGGLGGPPPAAPHLQVVPNVSEGRDRGVIRALGDAVEAAGVRLLDVHADVDHHRSVFTYLGAPDAVERATLALARVAVERIDLRRHQGVHPRVGAVDVVPFIPLRGTSMAEAVQCARRVGRAFSEATGVPVFFYAEAAANPARRELPVIRWGGFEGLAERLVDPAWYPDCGAAAPHPRAGVTVVGARGPLIAFNAMLDTPDVATAKSIAAVVRQSAPGGLPAVRALGVSLASRGIAQVAMNLLDHRRTSPAAVADRVEREAQARGVAVREWELVGCAPADAWTDWTTTSRVLDARPEQILDAALFTIPGD